MGLRRRSIAVASTAVALLTAQVAFAAPGDLDTRFNRTGVVIIDLQSAAAHDDAEDVVIGPRGSIIVAGTDYEDGGDLALVRYSPRGRLVRNFGVNGIVRTNVDASGASIDAAHAVALQPDGKIVVAGETDRDGDQDFLVARYTSRGVLDDTFGDGGIVVTDVAGLGYDDYAVDVAIGPGGTIIVGGRAKNETDPSDQPWQIAVARYTSTGALDTTFGDGSDGRTILAYGYSVEVNAMAVQGDGRILLAGTARAPGVVDFAIARFLDDGIVDTDFDWDGILSMDLGTIEEGGTSGEDAFDIAVQSYGGLEKILVTGQVQHGPSNEIDLALVRLLEPLGGLDPSFGGNGIRFEDLGGWDSGHQIVVKNDGSFAVVGYDAYYGLTMQISFHLASGGLDTASGTGAAYAYLGPQSVANAGALAPDGGVIAVGWTNSVGTDEHDFAVVKFLTS